MKVTIRQFGKDDIQVETTKFEIKLGWQEFVVTVENDEFLQILSVRALQIYPRASNAICLKSVEW